MAWEEWGTLPLPEGGVGALWRGWGLRLSTRPEVARAHLLIRCRRGVSSRPPPWGGVRKGGGSRGGRHQAARAGGGSCGARSELEQLLSTCFFFPLSSFSRASHACNCTRAMRAPRMHRMHRTHLARLTPAPPFVRRPSPSFCGSKGRRSLAPTPAPQRHRRRQWRRSLRQRGRVRRAAAARR